MICNMIQLMPRVTDVSQTITFPDKTIPGQDLSRTITYLDKTFPGRLRALTRRLFPVQDVSRTITFLDRRFPDSYFPGQFV